MKLSAQPHNSQDIVVNLLIHGTHPEATPTVNSPVICSRRLELDIAWVLTVGSL